MAKFDYLELQSDYETDIQSALLEKGVFSVRGIDAFPPLRKYSDSEINNWVDSAKIDAILVLIPQGVSTGTSSSLNQLTGTVNTHQTLDAVYSEASLIEPKSGQEMYRASLSSSLSELASSENARWSAAINLADDLQANDFLVATKKSVHRNHYVK